jgi:secondary thiamine-phosphate synthase enzyme
LTINEHADPDVTADILMVLRKLVPDSLPYEHGEGNSPAHVKASLLGSSVQVIIENGRLALGTWQGIFFGEFDGPRKRKVYLHIR